ncbi:hypothetical protein ACPFP2_10340 [Micromonospora citrea]|uniref:hypothetical protein n=1 Tax=Micromonospora citrea TaxID=47855 RepID=UPI003C397DA4
MNALPVRLLACLVLTFLAACDTTPSGPVAATCCEARYVNRSYQPGETLTVHWSVGPSDEPGAIPPQVQLTARLTGPFATVDDLKAATGDTRSVPGLVTFAAAPIRPAGSPDEPPVSTIVIGPDARPGFYNLVTSVGGDDSGASDRASVVRIVPKA